MIVLDHEHLFMDLIFSLAGQKLGKEEIDRRLVEAIPTPP